jgi:S-adenosylmethionine hydrolase
LDGFVAACHGVIARIAPHARVLDVTHAVPPGDVRRGSVVLADTLSWLPPAVHVAVVDPGVGTTRRGIALVSGDAILADHPAAEARAIDNPDFTIARLGRPISATFHGRDIFAPAAAHVACGVSPDALGPAVDPESLIALPTPLCQVHGQRIRVEVLNVDHFGNVALAVGADELEAVGLRTGTTATLRWPSGAQPVLCGTTFADVAQGDLVLLVDSAGHLAVARRGGSAADRTGLRPGTVVELLVETQQP